MTSTKAIELTLKYHQPKLDELYSKIEKAASSGNFWVEVEVSDLNYQNKFFVQELEKNGFKIRKVERSGYEIRHKYYVTWLDKLPEENEM